jgi:hypothetical protein
MTQPPGGDRREARPPRCTQPKPAARRRPRKRDAPATACPGGQEGRELTEEDHEWARRIVAGLPPLTDRQRDILARLLRTRR